jgi:hypothetical protein
MDNTTDYLRIGKATDLAGRDYKIYRILEIFPGFLSIFTLFALSILSYLQPVWVAYFIIAFDVYWLLLVIYMAIFLITSYRRLRIGLNTNWREKCEELKHKTVGAAIWPVDALTNQGLAWNDLRHLIILPTLNESAVIIRSSLQALIDDGFPTEQMIVVLAMEERSGQEAHDKAEIIEREFAQKFGRFIVTFHPDGVVGELKGKGANQAWAARVVKDKIIDAEHIDYGKILVSVFDIDTEVKAGYFFALSYKFLTVRDPYHSSYQPVPFYQNNIWEAPFFSRVTACSNTFWQMIMQIREESLVTYSSHSMTWRALEEIDFWSTTNVSEDSRIFWHCFMYYNAHYRVEPITYEVSMDITHDETLWLTAKSLYKQQRRWAWGGENIPYLIFNTGKRWHNPGFDRKKALSHILIQVYGFHSWATNALIIAVIGWLPLLFGGDRFNSTVLSGNLPYVTQNLMSVAMIGLVLSAAISALLLPRQQEKPKFGKRLWMVFEWVFVPVIIIIFGSVPCLDAQMRLMAGKYMGFLVTPKSR